MVDQHQPHSPTSLSDLKTGATIPGDKDETGDVEVIFITKPEWYDPDRFKRGQEFMKSYKSGVVFAYLLAILVGFTVDSLTNALIFTGLSVGPAKARKRYIHTIDYLIRWHEGGDIFDPNSVAGKSILLVRHMHHHVRKAMSMRPYEKIQNEQDKENMSTTPCKSLPMNQFDMSLVQSGFIGPMLLQPKICGINASTKEFEDYIYFWRIIGWCLGIKDEYNMCGVNEKITFHISEQIEEEIIIKGLKHPTSHFKLLSSDFVKGMRWVIPFLNQPAVHKYVYPGMGIPPPHISGFQWLFYWGIYVVAWLSYRVTLFRYGINFVVTYYLRFSIWLYS